ncbi:hypothetical protein [Streptomyces sp. RLB3-6]|uniref:hypothetical protein n=1 Tax=Streptomyces sp. RLB3-6 TaxID=2594457 RepID=UPI0011636118|nr:hypothetical protein [Streptomyces sp. RLB3-6]QDN84423.1 hypothetical protein FNV61_00440 [Streptomyces sp. RLB3-6]
MIRDAVTCDRPGCLALYLEPDDLPEEQPFETAVAAAGWQLGTDGHACPGCSKGKGPVLERGECPRCCGSTGERPAGTTCRYCGHVQPYPDGAQDW